MDTYMTPNVLKNCVLLAWECSIYSNKTEYCVSIVCLFVNLRIQTFVLRDKYVNYETVIYV